MNKQKTIMMALAAALLLTSLYIIYEKIIESRNQEMLSAFQSGYNKGLTDAVTALFKQTDNCHQTSISLGNMTKYVFDLSCVRNGSR